MKRSARLRALLPAVLALALELQACVGPPQSEEPPEKLNSAARFTEAGHKAFEEGLYSQAAALYSKALEQSYARDDQAAIPDALYNLAVTLLQLGRYEEALERVRQAQAETRRAGGNVTADTLLLEATLLYRMKRPAEAMAVSERIVSVSSGSTSDAVMRAHFLRGLMAAEAGDTRALQLELSALGQPADRGLLGDQQELVGYLARAQGDNQRAVRAFGRSAELRSEASDYRGLVRVLASAGEVYAEAGNVEAAAGQFLRAGRSAALQGEKDAATAWLTRAADLARASGDAEISEEARAHLEKLEQGED